MSRLISSVALVSVLVIACEGPAGPQGPQEQTWTMTPDKCVVNTY
jgi:hypothetical protein